MSEVRFVRALLASALVGLCGSANAVVVDLVNNQTGAAAGALFWRADYQSAGTGYLDPFVRLRHDNAPPNNGHSPRGEEQGYNTSGRPSQYDELTDGNFTRDLLFSEIPQVTIAGVPYLQFLLDINEPIGGTQSLLSLDQVNIYTSGTGGQTGLESTLGTLRWSLSISLDNPHVVTLDANLNSGSGQGDMQMYVPLSNFQGVQPTDYVYLYSYFGHWMPTDFQTGDGFEEWSVLVPAPGSLGVMGLAALVAARRRRAPAAR
jgi:hypothetical protein